MASEDFEGVEIHADDEVLRRDMDRSSVVDDERVSALPEDEASEAPAAPAATTSTSSKTKRYLALAAAGAALLGIVIGLGAGLGTQKNDRAVSASHITGVTLADCLEEAEEMLTSSKSGKSTSGGGKSGKGTSMSYASKSSKSGSDPDREDIPSLVELSPTMAPTEQGTTTVAKEALSDLVRRRELRGGDLRVRATQRISSESDGDEQIERNLNENYYPTCKDALDDYYGSKSSKSGDGPTVASKSSKAGGGSKSSKSATPTDSPTGSPTTSPSTCGDRTLTCGNVVTCSTANQPSVSAPSCGQIENGSGGAVWYQIVGTGGWLGLHTCGGSTDFDTRIRVYLNEFPERGCFAGNEDGGCIGGGIRFGASVVNFPSIAGVVYNILVDGRGDAEGTFTLTVGCSNQECPDCLEPVTNEPGDECPDDPGFLPPCKDAFVEVGELCEGAQPDSGLGQCGTDKDLDNCVADTDVYRKCS